MRETQVDQSSQVKVVIMLGPGGNNQKVDAVAAKFRNATIIVIEELRGVAKLHEITNPNVKGIEASYGEYDEEVVEHYLDLYVGGKRADVMFAIYPNLDGARQIPFAIKTYLAPKGKFYTAADTDVIFNAMKLPDILNPIQVRGPREGGVTAAAIRNGENGPNIKFESTQQGLAHLYDVTVNYDFWGTKK